MSAERTYDIASLIRLALTGLALFSTTHGLALGQAPPSPPPSTSSEFSTPAPAAAVPSEPNPNAGANSPAGRLGPGSQAQEGLDLQAYKLLRYDEDYSYLKDPRRRTDFWDGLKYIPLGDRDDHYLSLGAELRPRYEFYHNPNFGAGPQNSQSNNGYLLQRYMLHGDLHLGPDLRFFGQLQSGFEDGSIGGPRPDIDVDRFDAHQAFLDWVYRWDDEEQEDASKSLTLRPGRQEMSYGSGRLIDVREGANLRRSFDAARFLLNSGRWQVDGFWSKPVRNRPGVFDNDPAPNLSLWGLYAVGPLDFLPDGHTDLYYLGYENKHASYDEGKGYELRHSIGTRIWGRPMPWEYNFEYVAQFGRFGSGDIGAWTAANAIRYNFNDLPLTPRLGLRFDLASGDRNPRSPNLQTFNPLFPSGAYFNLANPIGPQNIIDLHPVLDFNLGPKTTVTADWNFFWRESLEDGIYTLSGVPLRPGTPGRARYIGSSPSLTTSWKLTRHITILASYVHFFPGPYLQEHPPAKNIDFVTTWLDYMF